MHRVRFGHNVTTIRVHHHGKEVFGNHHLCKYNRQSKSCQCRCDVDESAYVKIVSHTRILAPMAPKSDFAAD